MFSQKAIKKIEIKKKNEIVHKNHKKFKNHKKKWKNYCELIGEFSSFQKWSRSDFVVDEVHVKKVESWL